MMNGIINRKQNRENAITSLLDAHKIIFAPLTFQTVATLLDLGILQEISNQPLTINEIQEKLNLSEYIVRTLLQVAGSTNIVTLNQDKYSLTKCGEMFLYDEMTIANFNFVKDVCYLGASELTNSFKEEKPKGLHKFVGGYKTIYPALSKLPEKMKKSWYEFDHLYSDNCFEEVLRIINKQHNRIFDIGGNTGKFEQVCLKHNCEITMLDLPENVKLVENNPKFKNCKFYPIDVLANDVKYPDLKNSAILMSQFLDCFSKKQILKILTDLRKCMNESSTIYILEPFTDTQQFEAAALSLKHISLYFTCMANGVSKMYEKTEMLDLISRAGLTVKAIHDNIPPFDYTLLECQKDELV